MSDAPRAGMTYRDAGVDIDAKMEAVERLKARAAGTLGEVAGPIGHFGGTYRVPGMTGQTLVASADGVGTKLRLAFTLGGDAHARMGEDIVNHCANDVLALGATPLFFLDYFGTGRLDPDVVTAVVGGVADACAAAGMALIGGETAEMPDMYADGEYDLAGFIVGSVRDDEMVDGSRIEVDDIVIGLPSTGLHTNGYSLARRIIGLTGDREADRERLSKPLDDGDGVDIGSALLAPHRCYVPQVLPLARAGLVRGMAHITGGGLLDNLPRTLPDHAIARLDPESWTVPPVFTHLIERGNVPEAGRYRVFNMGIGFVLVVSPEDAEAVLDALDDAVGGPVVIGQVIPRVTSDESAVQGLACA